jgi:hypothetical protein
MILMMIIIIIIQYNKNPQYACSITAHTKKYHMYDPLHKCQDPYRIGQKRKQTGIRHSMIAGRVDAMNCAQCQALNCKQNNIRYFNVTSVTVGRLVMYSRECCVNKIR